MPIPSWKSSDREFILAGNYELLDALINRANKLEAENKMLRNQLNEAMDRLEDLEGI